MASLKMVVLLLAAAVIALVQGDIFSQAVGPCIGNRCQPGHACFQGQCVPQALVPRMRADTAIGPCVNALCPGGHFCRQGMCYPL